MIPHSRKTMLLKAMQTRILGVAKKALKTEDITIDELEDEITNRLITQGESSTKLMLRRWGMTDEMIHRGLVWQKSKKGRGGSVFMRDSLKDIMDYEFYGVQTGVWPNIKRFRKWVEFRVIVRDPGLKKEYNSHTARGRASMVDRLTYLFSKAVHDRGLQRYATIDPSARPVTRKEEEKFHKKYDEKHEPIVVYYGQTGRRQRRIVPHRREVSEYDKRSNKDWADMEI